MGASRAEGAVVVSAGKDSVIDLSVGSGPSADTSGKVSSAEATWWCVCSSSCVGPAEVGSSVRTPEMDWGSVGTVSLTGVFGDIVSISFGVKADSSELLDNGYSPELDDFRGNLNFLSISFGRSLSCFISLPVQFPVCFWFGTSRPG